MLLDHFQSAATLFCQPVLFPSQKFKRVIWPGHWQCIGPKSTRALTSKYIFPFSRGEERRKNKRKCWFKSNLGSFQHRFSRDIVLLLRKRGMAQKYHPPSAASNIWWDLGSVYSSDWPTNISAMHGVEVLRALGLKHLHKMWNSPSPVILSVW